MGFESGSISCRVFLLPRPLPEDAVARFAAHAAPPLETVGEEPSIGWVTGRHLLDRNITPETAYFGGCLRLTLRQAERKVPTSLLRAECRMEELSLLTANGRDYLNSRERAEIRRVVAARLQPQMPPQLKGISVIHNPESRFLYATASSVAQSDLLVARFVATLKFHLIPLTPGSALLERKKVDAKSWRPASFAPDIPDDGLEMQPGRDFLTWLWFMADVSEGHIDLPEHGDVGVLIEGPLTFVHEGRGAHETVLRRGEPINSAEAKTALISGKKLKLATLTIALGDAQWRAVIDADEFSFRSLRLPETEPGLDPLSTFLDRMGALDRFRDLFYALYDLFADQRASAPEWGRTKKRIHEWVRAREEWF